MKRRIEEEQDAIVPNKHHIAFAPLTPLVAETTVPQMKRTNEGNMDAIDFAPLKRRRCLDDAQTSELDPIFVRIVGWLRDQQSRGSMPKSLSKLSRAIAPMCRAMVQVDSTVVFYHLVFNRVILIEDNGDGSVTYAANPEPVRCSFVGIVPADAPAVPFSDDFVLALERSTAWVLSNRGLRYFKNPEGILSSLRQICKMKKEINPEHVVEMLLRRGFISRTGVADEIIYGLAQHPLLPSPSPTHYAATYSEL